MGKRLSKIYTRTGDDGSTGLGDGSRTAKDSVRVEAYGTVDELNSALGVLRAGSIPDGTDALLAEIQQQLFDLGGELCIPGSQTIGDAHTGSLEHHLDSLNEGLPPLNDFVLPGGTPAAAACHMARAICRRAERRVCSLAAAEDVNPASIRYLNRLSDLLFVLARHINSAAGTAEILWQSDRQSDT